MAAETNEDGSGGAQLADLLAKHREPLVRFLAKEASGLRRFEDAEDLAQGVHLHALKVADRFEYQGEKPFFGWLFAVARRYIADRNAYWKALKRDAGPLLRVTFGGSGSEPGAAMAPPARITGPQTFAQRREHLSTAARVISALPERDQVIASMITRDLSIDEIAAELDVSYEAAQRARLRTIERFGKLYVLATEGAPSN